MILLRRGWNRYLNSCWIAAFVAICIFCLLGWFFVFWDTGCIATPWIMVAWIDSLMGFVGWILYPTSLLGILVCAIYQFRKRLRTKWYTLALFFGVLFCTVFGLFVLSLSTILDDDDGSNMQCNGTSKAISSSVSIAERLGGLNKLPKSATKITGQRQEELVVTSATVSFEAPESEIQVWLKSSPGIKKTTLSTSPDGSKTYGRRCDGLRFELVWSSDRRKVTIDTGTGLVKRPENPCT